jgi:hypothetical protein
MYARWYARSFFTSIPINLFPYYFGLALSKPQDAILPGYNRHGTRNNLTRTVWQTQTILDNFPLGIRQMLAGALNMSLFAKARGCLLAQTYVSMLADECVAGKLTGPQARLG